jgi:hypothetical protein
MSQLAMLTATRSVVCDGKRQYDVLACYSWRQFAEYFANMLQKCRQVCVHYGYHVPIIVTCEGLALRYDLGENGAGLSNPQAWINFILDAIAAVNTLIFCVAKENNRTGDLREDMKDYKFEHNDLLCNRHWTYQYRILHDLWLRALTL